VPCGAGYLPGGRDGRWDAVRDPEQRLRSSPRSPPGPPIYVLLVVAPWPSPGGGRRGRRGSLRHAEGGWAGRARCLSRRRCWLRPSGRRL